MTIENIYNNRVLFFVFVGYFEVNDVFELGNKWQNEIKKIEDLFYIVLNLRILFGSFYETSVVSMRFELRYFIEYILVHLNS